MKRWIGGILVSMLILVHTAEATEIIEDAEDGRTTGWVVRSNDGATVTNRFDQASQSSVIQFNGNRVNSSYMIGALNGAGALNNRTDRFITWRMRFAEDSIFYVVVQTERGLRYLFYTPSFNTGLRHGFTGGIHHGLGATMRDGRWRTVTRDLVRDLHDAEPENTLISVNALIVRGSGSVDDIVLFNPNETIYEDGNQGTQRWRISDNTPRARIRNIPDNDRQGRQLQGNVIHLNGNRSVANAYQIGDRRGNGVWNDQAHQLFQWRFRNFGPEVEVIDPRGIIRDPRAFEFRIFVETEQGRRDLIYTLGEENRGLNGITIHHGLGDDRIRGSVWAGDDPMNEPGLWQAVTRDLEEDIRDFESDNRLIAINGFQVRGNGLVDDIKTFARYDTDIRDDMHVVYENAEDGNTRGWSIYDDRPRGAAIHNIIDETRGGHVIELSGDGYNNGFMLGDRQRRGGWNNREDSRIRWSMNYDEGFVIYIPVETRNGLRYLVYSPTNEDRGRRGEYIQIGLGADADNGTWQTFTRNLAEDLERFEPGNQLRAIYGFMIRGSGRIDDIGTVN